MYRPLGQSARLKQLQADNPLEAKLALAALYLLAFMPLALIIKRWMADVAGVQIGLLFLYRSWKFKDWSWVRETPVTIALVLWLYTLIIVSPLAIEPLNSFARSTTWWRYILMFAAVAYWLSDYTQEIRRICVWIAGLLFLVALDSYWQYFTGFDVFGHVKPEARLTGPFKKLIVGIYLAKMVFPITGILLYYAWNEKRWRTVAACFALITAVMAAIALSNERTALITFIAGLGLIGVMLFFFLKNARWLVVLLGVVQIGVLFLIYSTQPEFQGRLHESSGQISSFGDSTYAQLWKASFLVWKENPFFGVGLMNFRIACWPLYHEHIVKYCDLHSHSVYLEWLSEAGAFGFIGICAIVLSLILAIGRRIRITEPERFIIVSFSLAGLLPTFFPLAATQSFLSNWPAMMTWFSIALALGMIRNVPND